MTILGQTIDLITIGIWAAAGVVLGAVFLVGRRPLGFIGDVVLGIIGGFLAGFAGVKLGFDFANYIPADMVSVDNAARISSFITALIGALVLLILIRLIKRN